MAGRSSREEAPQSYAPGAANARCSTGCSRPSAQGRAGRSWYLASRGWARRRCWSTSSRTRRASGSHAPSVSSRRWSFRSPRRISCSRRCSTGWTISPPRSAARRAGCGVRAELGARAGSLPRGAGGAQPARRCGGGTTNAVPRGRRAVAGSRPRRCSPSLRAGCWRSRSARCSRRASAARSSRACRSSSWRALRATMPAPCWPRRCGRRSTRVWPIGSWRRRAEIRSRCSSCRGGSRRRS
jgi:hypothetical protein